MADVVLGIDVGTTATKVTAYDTAGEALGRAAVEYPLEEAERLRSSPQGRALHRRTGTPAHPMAPLAKLMWFRERAAKVFAAAGRWVGIKEYVLARLTGEWAVDHSVASGTGLLDLHALDWDREALGLAGIEREQLAPLVPTTHVLAGLTA